MKKTVSMLLCICLIICCSACSINNEINPSEPTNTEDLGKPSYSTPKRLYVHSDDEFVELWNLRYADAETIMKHTYDPDLAPNSDTCIISNKQLNNLLASIVDIKMPYIKEESKYKRTMLDYDLDLKVFDVIYSRETFVEGKMLVRFNTWASINVANYEVAGYITVAGERVTLYRYKDPSQAGTYKLIGFMRTTNSEWAILFSKDVEMSKIQEIADYIEITTIREIIRQRTAAQSDD